MHNKKLTAFLALALILLIALPVSADSVSFTHPEIGEFLTIDFHDHLPFFSIYGYVYYELVDAQQPWRGMVANAEKLINNKMHTLEQALDKLFDSVEGLTEDREPAAFMYTGLLEEYADQLSALPRKDRIKAIRILGGFDGPKGYRQLNKMTGFEEVDTKALEESHQEFTVKAGKPKYAYRALMFHVDEGNWVEYNERYDFVKVSGKWKLARIAKEYTDDYRTRGKYLHGMAGSDPQDILQVNAQALRDWQFGMKSQELAQMEGVQSQGKDLVLPETTVYRLPAQATFAFKGDKLEKVTFALDSVQAYYSAFISLYTRYSDPVMVEGEGLMTWCTNDLLITLSLNTDAPTIVFEAYK